MSNPPAYYATARREVASLLPPGPGRILEIGCGTGATLSFLKESGRCSWAGGVELVPAVHAVAAGHLDQTWCGNFETLDLGLPEAQLDAVLCLDVLEHLADPWSAVSRLAALLKPGGVLIASIPNVRHYKVSFGLLFGGRWDYQDAGILDRTHLRFFVRATAEELLTRGGLRVDHVQPLPTLKPRKLKWLLRKLGGKKMDGFFAIQYLLRGVKA